MQTLGKNLAKKDFKTKFKSQNNREQRVVSVFDEVSHCFAISSLNAHWARAQRILQKEVAFWYQMEGKTPLELFHFPLFLVYTWNSIYNHLNRITFYLKCKTSPFFSIFFSNFISSSGFIFGTSDNYYTEMQCEWI